MTNDPHQNFESEGSVTAAFAELAERRERTTNLGEAYKGVVVAKPKRRVVWPALGATVLAAAAIAVALGLANDNQTVELGPATETAPPVSIDEENDPIESSVPPATDPPPDEETVEEPVATEEPSPNSTVEPPPSEEPIVEEEPPADEPSPAGFHSTAEAAVAAGVDPSIGYRGDCETIRGQFADGYCTRRSNLALPGGLQDFDLYEVERMDDLASAFTGLTMQQQEDAWRVVDDHLHDVIYSDRNGVTYDITEFETIPQNLLVDIRDYWEFENPVTWCDQLSKERIAVSCVDAEPGLFPDFPFGTWTVRLFNYDDAGVGSDGGTFPFGKNGDFYEYIGPN